MLSHWMDLARSTALLGLESQRVITLRVAKIAQGGSAAQQEAHLMVAEKVAANNIAAWKASAGSSLHAIVEMYRGKVRENIERLALQ